MDYTFKGLGNCLQTFPFLNPSSFFPTNCQKCDCTASSHSFLHSCEMGVEKTRAINASCV